MVRRYELGLRIPKVDKLERIAHTLGPNAQVLLSADFDNITAIIVCFSYFVSILRHSDF